MEQWEKISCNPVGAYVYAVCVDGEVRYIGKGRNRRWREHLYRVTQVLNGRSKDKHGKFIGRLISAHLSGADICVRLVAENMSDDEAFDLERKTIASFDRRKIWNCDDGGTGPTSEQVSVAMSSPEIRRRISEGTIKGLSDPVVREARRQTQIEAAKRADVKERRSRIAKEKWSDPSWKDQFLKRLNSDEVKAKMVAAAKRRPVRAGFVEDMKAAQKVKYAADRRSAVLKKALSGDEVRKKISDASRAIWSDPEKRARILEAQRKAREAKRNDKDIRRS